MRLSAHRTALSVAAAGLLAALTIVAPAAAAPTGMECTNGPTFNLTARAGQMETPDGNSALMWSYAPTGGHFQTPGPVLCVDEGDTVTVHLHNALTETTSLVFPGQTGGITTTGGSSGLFAKEVAAGGDITYTFTANNPGTYIYESGTDPSKQVEMGLASAIVVRPAGHADRAYGDAATSFSDEYLIMLNEIDPELHSAVENGTAFDIATRKDRYYTINGRSFPDTLQDNDVPWLENQPYGALVHIKPYDATLNPRPVLIRMINVGTANHPFHPHGENLQFIGQDGREIKTPGGNDAVTEHFAETVPSGATEDFLLSFRDQDSFAPGNPVPVTFPSYRDMTFKDANTWYSGSPYLGTVGKLPSTTVSQQNVCGAFFFPWHSHALNEFANYDAGFGGMATLLRIDPLTGCGTPGLTTRTASPDSVTRTSPTPIVTSTTLLPNGLAAIGGLRADILSNISLSGNTTRTTDWYATFNNVPASGVQNLKVYYTGRNRRILQPTSGWTPGCAQTVRIWNWTTNNWNIPSLDSQTVGGTDVAIPDPVPSAPDSKYIGTGPNAGQVRVGVRCVLTGPGAVNFFSSGDFMQITYDAP
jgi:hypothetical protein